MYHFIVEATLAQPGQHFIADYLDAARAAARLPRRACSNVSLDEQRHIGFGVKLLRDLAREDPEVPEAVAELLREVSRIARRVRPAGLGRRYTECFGFTLEQIYEEGARSFETKLRTAGLPLESLPGPAVYPDTTCRPRSAPSAALAMLRAGYLGEKNGGARARPGGDGAAVRQIRRGVDPRTAPDGPLTLQWEFPDAEPWHVRARQRLDRGRAGPRAATPTSSCAAASTTGSTWSPGGWTRSGGRHPAAEAEGLAAGAVARPRDFLGSPAWQRN